MLNFKKRWTLTIVETTKNFIFGGFTTAEWESPPGDDYISKRDPHSFLFSVNERKKYPIAGGDRVAIGCYNGCSAYFGTYDFGIGSDSNNNNRSYCHANEPSFNLPAGKGSKFPSMNGGEHYFQLK